MPKFEQYYCITISPKRVPTDQLKLHKAYAINITRQLNKFSSRYILYPEFDKNYRLHYHGMILVHDYIKMVRVKHLLDKIGFTKIDKPKNFKNRLNYLIYCQKDYKSIMDKFEPIIYMPLRKRMKLSLHKKHIPSPTITDWLKLMNQKQS